MYDYSYYDLGSTSRRAVVIWYFFVPGIQFQLSDSMQASLSAVFLMHLVFIGEEENLILAGWEGCSQHRYLLPRSIAATKTDYVQRLR